MYSNPEVILRMHNIKPVVRSSSLMQRVTPRTFHTAWQLSQTLFRPLQKLKDIRIELGFRHINFCSVTKDRMAYKTLERGRLNSEDYRMFITKDNNIVSPFHDIPLFANEETVVCNMVVEIPRWTNHKMEINKEEPMNPIKQDVKKGKVRFVKNCFPHHGYIWNYGALPQTWEDVDHEEKGTGTKGDNDPLDVCEIGYKVHKRGSVIQVKILGVMCLVDEGETDWKIICIDVTDPLAEKLNDIQDVEKEMPGFIKATKEWFEIYKIPDGKPPNKFGFDGAAKDRDFAVNVVKETHKQWKDMMEKEKAKGICFKNVSLDFCQSKITNEEAMKAVEETAGVGPAEDLPEDVDKWYYIPDSQL